MTVNLTIGVIIHVSDTLTRENIIDETKVGGTKLCEGYTFTNPLRKHTGGFCIFRHAAF
jgi:hypothetical protein